LHAPDEFFNDRSVLQKSSAVRNVNQYLNSMRLQLGRIYSGKELKHGFCQEVAQYTARAHSTRQGEDYLCFVYFVERPIFLAIMFERVAKAEPPLAPGTRTRPDDTRCYRFAGSRYLDAKQQQTAKPKKPLRS
jgi:hypothetical protein